MNPTKRLKTIRNHSAAHLFHQAIKDIFGKHANQQGSQVSEKSWRFDFNHFENEPESRILEVEKLVKKYILETPLEVVIHQMPIDEARKLGAMALFGEKYGDIVRVVDMGWSKELCGGTHVKNTKEIIDFAIGSYESIGSGTYRMEGVTGFDVKKEMMTFLEPLFNEIETLNEKLHKLDKSIKLPKQPDITGSYQDVINYRHYVIELKEFIKTTEKELQRYKEQGVLSHIDTYITDFETKKQIIKTKDLDPKVLKQLIDAIYDRIKAETIVLVNVSSEKATFLCKSSHDDASSLIRYAAELTKGSGGGKPQFAQGGTQELSLVDQMILKLKEKL